MTLIKKAVIAAAVAFAGWSAHAAEVPLSLAATVANAYTSQYDYDNTHYDRWTIALDGLDTSNPVSVSIGDIVKATISFDSAVTVPVPLELTFYSFRLTGPDFPSTSINTVGTADFMLGGATVAHFNTNCQTNSGLATCWVTYPPGNGVTFDTVSLTSAINRLDSTSTATGATFSYTLFSPAVPEPTTSLLFALGLPGLALVKRAVRRRSA